jgi:hypothetical protein
VKLRPFELEHLNLDAVRQAGRRIRLRIAPGEHTGIASRFHVHPLDVQDEILVLLHRAHDADGMAGTDEEPILDLPGVLRGVDVHPPGQVLAVEQVYELAR